MGTATVTKSFPPQSVEWEGKLYGPGETIPDLPAKEMKRLKALGLIEVSKEVPEEDPEKKETGKKKKDPEPEPKK